MMVTPWQADWNQLERDFAIQAKDRSRVSLVDCARTGKKALQLMTLPGDIDVVFSGNLQRCDVAHIIPGTLDPRTFREGDEVWVAHAVMFPDTFKAPLWHSYTVFDFHAVKAIPANMDIGFRRWPGRDDLPGQLQIRRMFGNSTAPTERYVTLGLPLRNVWLDFIHHFIWSSTVGLYEGYLNGVKVTSQKGPTLFDDGQEVYMKLANYHLPYIDQPDVPSCVIHDRVRIGPTKADVL